MRARCRREVEDGQKRAAIAGEIALQREIGGEHEQRDGQPEIVGAEPGQFLDAAGNDAEDQGRVADKKHVGIDTGHGELVLVDPIPEIARVAIIECGAGKPEPTQEEERSGADRTHASQRAHAGPRAGAALERAVMPDFRKWGMASKVTFNQGWH